MAYGSLGLLRAEMRAGYGAAVMLQAAPAQVEAGLPERRCVAVRGFSTEGGTRRCCYATPVREKMIFDCETAMPLDEFMVAWDNVALLMRQRKTNTRRWAAPVAAHGYVRWAARLPVSTGCTSTAQSIFCRTISVRRAAFLPVACPMSTPTPPQPTGILPLWSQCRGGVELAHGDTPRKYTVYAIDTAGRMIVGDVTV